MFKYWFFKILFIFRLKDDTLYSETPNVLDEDFTIVRALKPGETYEFKVVAVDGDYMSESEPQEIDTYTIGLY